MNSTTIKPVIFFIAAVVALGASVVSAQETGRVAILDVAKVFKDNTSFGDKMAALKAEAERLKGQVTACLLYTSPSPRDQRGSRMPSCA